MIVRFDSKTMDKVGNKAKSLMEMKQNKFNVPNGFSLDSDTYKEEVKANGIDKKINNLLNKLNKDNVSKISSDITKLFDNFKFTKETKNEVESLLKNNKLYAVRSSGTKEDLESFSFAGQYKTFLNTKSIDVLNNVIECYKSMFSEIVLSYIVNNEIDSSDLSISVIVQEMVQSEYSGICFTIDPISGNDKKMLIEVGEGLGENIVSGQNKPEQYYYDWFNNKAEFDKKNKYLTKKQVEKFAPKFFEVMSYFGYPCDIEFAIVKDELYILQARKITKIKYQDYNYIWTTADFKDGGVSASVCTPYMWSLYEYIWEYSLRKFIVDSKILKDKELPKKLGEMFYGRPYWNLSAVKKTMSQVVGYKEREFDSEYGITPTYEGDGETTGVSIKSIIDIIRMALAQKKIVKEREENAESLKELLLNRYNNYKELYDTKTIPNIKEYFVKVTHDDYLFSETTYFWQIFINTIHQSLNKDSLLKHITEEDYLTLIGNIDDISHLLPFYEMWDVSRLIRKDKEIKKYWETTNVESIVKDYKKSKKNNNFSDVEEVIEKYGYHSDKELDVTYPCYYEDVTPIITNIKDLVTLDDSYSPERDQERGKKNFQKQMSKIKEKISEKNYKKLEKKILKIREMLWWREEFRDLSTRFYYIIRIYTVELSKQLVKEKVIEKEDDIWFTKVGDIWDFLDKKITKKDLDTIIEKNKIYYNAYRNYMSENEIGSVFDGEKVKVKSSMKGLGANNGTVTGVARVIESFNEIDRLQEGDILVTKFTDTGWTPKFAILSGIVTEFGGILCHAAIVSREYGIPAIVSCTGIMNEIKDGEIITINGTTGEIRKGK